MNTIHLPTDFQFKQENLHLPDQSNPDSRKRRFPFGHDSFSDHEQATIRQKLDTGLSRNETMQRPGPGGMRITYIEGWKVIHHANQIFGFNGWSSKIVSTDIRYIDEARGRFSACVSASVCVTLRDGASREDRGGGIAENMRSKGEAILKAEKEAITDATKRALKNFGLRLGLSLYDRQHVREMNRTQPRDPTKETLSVNQPQNPHQPVNPPHKSSRFPQKAPSTSSVTPAQQAHAHAFHKVKNQNTVSSSASPKTSIDSALAAKVAANRQQEEAILRKQVLRRAHANQSAAASNPMAANAFQNPQSLPTTVEQMAARHLGANFQRPAQPGQSNAFSAGLSVAHGSAHLQAANASSRAANQAMSMQNAGLSVQQQFALSKQRQFAMRGNVQPNVANNPSARNPDGTVRPSTSCSSRTRSAATSAGLTVENAVGLPHAVDTDPNLQLEATGTGGITMKQTEIDELSAIALADF